MICIYCDTHKVHSFFSDKYCSKLCFELHQRQLQIHAEAQAREEEIFLKFAAVTGPEETERLLKKVREAHQGPFKAPWLKTK
jgi:hypothetical protein